MRARRELHRHHPSEAHWHLSHLAVDGARRRQGLGSALLAGGLALADHDGVGAYLETANEASLAFGERAGFHQVGRVELGGGPPIWLMWRNPVT